MIGHDEWSVVLGIASALTLLALGLALAFDRRAILLPFVVVLITVLAARVWYVTPERLAANIGLFCVGLALIGLHSWWDDLRRAVSSRLRDDADSSRTLRSTHRLSDDLLTAIGFGIVGVYAFTVVSLLGTSHPALASIGFAALTLLFWLSAEWSNRDRDLIVTSNIVAIACILSPVVVSASFLGNFRGWTGVQELFLLLTFFVGASIHYVRYRRIMALILTAIVFALASAAISTKYLGKP